jgi:putative transposase
MSNVTAFESLSHSKWDCKYHIVFVPKCRKKKLYGAIRKFLGPVFHELASQRGATIINGNMVQDHVHMLISIPPKYSVAEVIGYIKGKSAIAVARQFGNKKKKINKNSCEPEAMLFLLLDLRKVRPKITSRIKNAWTELVQMKTAFFRL